MVFTFSILNAILIIFGLRLCLINFQGHVTGFIANTLLRPHTKMMCNLHHSVSAKVDSAKNGHAQLN